MVCARFVGAELVPVQSGRGRDGLDLKVLVHEPIWNSASAERCDEEIHWKYRDCAVPTEGEGDTSSAVCVTSEATG